MSRALRYGLMGAVSGGLSQLLKMQQEAAAEAQSERLRRARMAEQMALQEWADGKRKAEKLEDREYSEKREEELYGRGRADKLTDEERAIEERKRQERVQAQEAAKGRAANLAVADRYAGRSSPDGVARVVENITTGEQRDLAPGEPIPEGFREVRAGARYAPSPVRARQPSGGGRSDASQPASAPAPASTQQSAVQGAMGQMQQGQPFDPNLFLKPFGVGS